MAAACAQAVGLEPCSLLCQPRSLPCPSSLLPRQSRTVCTCLRGLMVLGVLKQADEEILPCSLHRGAESSCIWSLPRAHLREEGVEDQGGTPLLALVPSKATQERTKVRRWGGSGCRDGQRKTKSTDWTLGLPGACSRGGLRRRAGDKALWRNVPGGLYSRDTGFGAGHRCLRPEWSHLLIIPQGPSEQGLHEGLL